MNLKTKRILMAFIGVVVTGISIGMFQSSALGTDPWSYVNILDTKSQTFLCCTSS